MQIYSGTTTHELMIRYESSRVRRADVLKVKNHDGYIVPRAETKTYTHQTARIEKQQKNRKAKQHQQKKTKQKKEKPNKPGTKLQNSSSATAFINDVTSLFYPTHLLNVTTSLITTSLILLLMDLRDTNK